MKLRDNRKRYYDCWHEDGRKYRYRKRRKLRHFERDIQKLG